MKALMQDRPLLISSLIEHANTFHAGGEIVSRTVEGPIHRCTYGDIHRRSKQVANALTAMGVKHGDRVGTLAWNGYRHMELYYGVSGMGAVLHTINPRLFPEQIVYIANHAEDQYIFFDLTFAPLIEKLAPQMTSVKAFIAMTDRAHMPGAQYPQPAVLRGTDRRAQCGLRMAGVRREHGLVALLYVGHDRQSKGRAVLAPLDGAPFVRCLHGRWSGALIEGVGAAGGADVPRQRLGHALRGRDVRRQARDAGSGS